MPNIYPGRTGDAPPIVPVTDADGKRLPLDVIQAFVMVAVDYARKRPEQSFKVQQDGWGYSRVDIAPMFDYCPDNITLPYGFMY